MRPGAPQPLKEVHRERGRGHRSDWADPRHRHHPAAGQHAPGSISVRRPGHRSVKSSQRDHLERLVTETISVPAEENKKFICHQEYRNRQWQEVKGNRLMYRWEPPRRGAQ